MNIIGSIMTGTHGSGIHNQPMSSFVKEVAFIDPSGEQRRLIKDQHHDEFTRFLHSFGALGIVFQMTIEITEAFPIRLCVYKDVPWDFIRNTREFDFMCYYYSHVSIFTDWRDQRMNSLWVGEVLNDDSWEDLKDLSHEEVCDKRQFGGTLVKKIDPVPHFTDEVPTTGSGIGDWNEKMLYFNVNNNQMPGDDGFKTITSEFYVEYHHFKAAVEDLYANKAKFAHLVLLSEFRTIEQDSIQLSPSKHQQQISISFKWQHDLEGVSAAVREI